MNAALPKIGYRGFGCYVPPRVVPNAEFEGFIETSDEWIQRRTGIQQRHILDNSETILAMAVKAARAALDDAGVAPGELGEIRVAVNTWLRFPSLATQLQKELEASNAAASDVSAGCAGFIYAVDDVFNKLVAERLLYEREVVALVVGVDALSHVTDWSDRETCVLLGDGAGAVVIGAVDDGGILATHTHADGRYGDLLFLDSFLEGQVDEADPGRFTHKEQGVRPYLRMKGRPLFSKAVKSMADGALAVLDKYNRTHSPAAQLADVTYIYPHQANLRIIEAVAKKLDVDLDKIYTSGIAQYGNTSTASIPIGYCERRPAGGGLELDLAFGAGFASGAILRQASSGRR
jgi:3-oxoacyl-[acyl-carrier-protein] synthase-3